MIDAPNVTATPAPELDILACLPDDERRIIIAWRNARAESRNGVAAIFAVKVFKEVLVFCGIFSGKAVLR